MPIHLLVFLSLTPTLGTEAHFSSSCLHPFVGDIISCTYALVRIGVQRIRREDALLVLGSLCQVGVRIEVLVW